VTATISRTTRTKGAAFSLGLAILFTALLAAHGGVASAYGAPRQDQASTTTARAGALLAVQTAPAAVGEQASSRPAAAPADAAGFPNPVKLAKCVASVAVAFVPTAKAYKAIKELGGVVETAKLLIGAGSSKEFLEIAGGGAAEILGIAGIADNCF
jgi:hypothetical protein